MKSIKHKILISTLLVVMVSLSILSAVSIYLNYSNSFELLEQNMMESAKIAAERVEKELSAYLNVSIDTGCVARLSASNQSLDSKKEIINQRVNVHGFQRGEIITPDGIGLISGNNFSDRDYFKKSINGIPYVSEPLVSKITGKITVIISAPIWEGGVPNSKVVGVVYFVPNETFLNDIVSSISVSENSAAYIINSSGVTIADNTMDTIGTQNIEEEAKTDSSLIELANIHSHMRNGESGFGHYSINDNSKISAYSTIPNTDGWSIAITALQSDFMNSTYFSIIITIILFIISIILATIISYSVADKITKPVRLCADCLKKISEGDLKAEIPDIKNKDETAVLADATNSIVNTIRDIIVDIDRVLRELSDGNFCVQNERADLYIGDFESLSDSIYQIIDKLNTDLLDINQSSEQVLSGAEQVSYGAQALSQGATEQAATVQQLVENLNKVSEQIKSNAQNASQMSEKTDYINNEISLGNEKMHEMLTAMNEINNKSMEIQKITKAVQEIALQTDILALNAAVEAVRAGEAGKGFTVVADEVRLLSSKVADASKDTSALIQQAILAVENGTKIANDTASTLSIIVDEITKITETISKVSDASKEQADSIEQVTTGVDQISSVVETNSATAQESAATSEQLSGQAQILKNMVGHFKLKTDGLFKKN